MTFPITIKRTTMLHSGGTKEYEIIALQSRDGNSLLIRRWGKVKTPGQIIVEQKELMNKAINGASNIIREKEARGYRVTRDMAETSAKDVNELMTQLTRNVYSRLGAENLKYILPDVETKGIRSPDNVDEDEPWDPNSPKALGAATKAAQELADQQARLAAVDAKKADPMWGRF